MYHRIERDSVDVRKESRFSSLVFFIVLHSEGEIQREVAHFMTEETYRYTLPILLMGLQSARFVAGKIRSPPVPGSIACLGILAESCKREDLTLSRSVEAASDRG